MSMSPGDVHGLKMPIPLHDPNPHRNGADAAMWEWIDKHQLCSGAAERQRMRAAESVLCMALYHPTADAFRFEGLCRWLGWSFLIDDVIDNPPVSTDPRAAAEVLQPLMAVLDGQKATTTLARGLADMWAHVTEGRSPGWLAEFTNATRRWLWAPYAHAAYVASGQHPTFADYRASTHSDVGGNLIPMALCEYAAGLDLPAPVRNLPAWIVMRRAASDHVGLVNDVYSTHIEDPQTWYFNMAFVLARQYGIDMAEAVQHTVTMANDCVDTYLRARRDVEAQLVGKVSEATRAAAIAIADAYGDAMRGNYDYHLRAERYADKPAGYRQGCFG